MLACWKVVISTAFFKVYFGWSSEMTFTCLVMSLQGWTKLPGKPRGWKAEMYMWCLFDTHSVAVFRERIWPDRLRRLKLSDPFPWMRIAESRERELLLDLITVKHWTLIGDIKHFMRAAVPTCNTTTVSQSKINQQQPSSSPSAPHLESNTALLCNFGEISCWHHSWHHRGQIYFKIPHYTVRSVFRCASVRVF